MNPLIAVIADDLTGVCDTGAQFAAAGLRTIGSVDREFESEDIPQALIVNTQSRSMEGAKASLCIGQAARSLKGFSPKWFFKKIDTALRGNIAIEVCSMMETLGVNLALYVAAIPGAGRTTVRGCQLFRGIPIKDSIHGEDRLNPNPVLTSSNVELLSVLPGVGIEVIGLDEVRSGHLEISHRPGEERKILIFDSETDGDIDQIVRTSMKMDPSSFLYVGSFGLSSALGRHLAESLRITEKKRNTLNERTPFRRDKKALVVSGSSHPMARSQIAYLQRKRKVEVVQFDPEDLTDRLEFCILEAVRVSRILRDHQKGVVLAIGDSRPGPRKQSQELVLALAKVANRLLDSCDVDALVLVGGETGYAVCRAVGVKRIEIQGDISFVAAYGKPEGFFKGLTTLVTKGGSLGEEDTLEKILDFVC
ncbi:MAG: four-carbon acid sugar kinase family protein [Deltaproteobacteria bacterium]|nr:MAG: four-carbon acid sugar kinase family protein [Deltaproteobacteria bacterium]